MASITTATMAGVSCGVRTIASPSPSSSSSMITMRPFGLTATLMRLKKQRSSSVVVAMGLPEGLSEKVAESIKEATEACSENPASGECVAAWDEVEELSAAASHARDRQKSTNPLDEFCKDNPEDEECRTYED